MHPQGDDRHRAAERAVIFRRAGTSPAAHEEGGEPHACQASDAEPKARRRRACQKGHRMALGVGEVVRIVDSVGVWVYMALR